MSEELLTVQQFAVALRCTVAAVRKWIRERQITTVKISRLVRIPASEVERLIAEGTRPAVHPKRRIDEL
jgi:excisionase family DNA binding protein